MWSPEKVTHIERFITAPKSSPAAAHAAASDARPSSRPKTRASPAPSNPAPAQPAICHGVHGPCPKKRFEASAATAPTMNPGAPPRT